MNVSSHALQEQLASLVSGSVRGAESADAIAGVVPQYVVEPMNEQEVSAVMAFANREGLKVSVRGAGTQLMMGTPPTACDIVLSTAQLNQIIEHEPHDMTVSVQAGLPLTALQTHLATTRQWLALDPVLEPGATIGGMISTNVSGPRRLRFGSIRDQIIGMRVVLPDGTIAKGGGKVVKNVAGYDLPKLYTGALGTLGVIVTATFRLYPLRAASRTILLSASSPTPLCELAVRVIGSTLEATAIDVISSLARDGSSTIAVRFETEPEPVADQAATYLNMAGTLADNVQMLEGEAEAHFWQQSAQQVTLANDAEDGLLIKASLLPTDVGAWLEQLRQITQQANVTALYRAHAGHGLIFARLNGEQAVLASVVQQLRQAASARQGHLVVTQASPTLARTVDVWGPIPALEMMRRLKARFDPNYIMNPGRFVGGL